MNKMLTARVNSLLMQGSEVQLYFAPFQLQKMLYLYYGEYIVKHDDELKEFRFEAWTHGPVIKSIYHKYEVYGSSEIKKMIDYAGTFYRVVDESLFREVIRKHGKKDFRELLELVHKQDGAWAKAFRLTEEPRELKFEDIKNEFKENHV